MRIAYLCFLFYFVLIELWVTYKEDSIFEQYVSGWKKALFHTVRLQRLCWYSLSQLYLHDTHLSVIYFCQIRVRALTPHNLIFSSFASSSFPRLDPFHPSVCPPPGPHYIISSDSCPLYHPSLLHTVCLVVTRPPDLGTFGGIKARNLWMRIYRNIFSMVTEKGEGKLPYLRNTNNTEKTIGTGRESSSSSGIAVELQDGG